MSDSDDRRKQLGRILLQKKLVAQSELDDLLRKQQEQPGQKLASTVVAAGRVGSVDVLKALSEQLGLPGVDLDQVVIPLDNLALIPLEIAKKHLVLPVTVKSDRIFLAMSEPKEKRMIDEIEFVTGRRVFGYVALAEPLRAVIDEAYRMAERGEEFYIGSGVPPEYLASLGLNSKRPSMPPDARKDLAPNPRSIVVSDKPPRPAQEVSFANLFGDQEDVPARSLPETAPAPASIAKVSNTILVVDDDDDVRGILRRVLSDRGYEVIEAARGSAALALIRDREPRLVLLDANLPEIHGFDICRRLRGSKRYGQLPVIMMSAVHRGWRVAEDVRKNYGVENFLEKPFRMPVLLEAVERLLSDTPMPTGTDELISADAQQALDAGLEAYKNGQIDDAIRYLVRGVSLDPLAFRIHYHLGLLYGRKEENLFDAIQSIETALELSPRSFSAAKNLAVLYEQAGFTSKSSELWQRALGLAPNEEIRSGIRDHLLNLL